jgi:hypothetical protein
VITEAGAKAGNVVGLVYVAAFAPEEGESVLDINGRFPDTAAGPALRTAMYPIEGADPGTELFLAPELFHEAFCADLPADTAAAMAVTQRPASFGAFGAGVTGPPAGKSLPSWFVVAAGDNTIHPDAERSMAERAGSDTIEIDASHSVAGSQPRAVADVIRRAVESTSAG